MKTFFEILSPRGCHYCCICLKPVFYPLAHWLTGTNMCLRCNHKLGQPPRPVKLLRDKRNRFLEDKYIGGITKMSDVAKVAQRKFSASRNVRTSSGLRINYSAEHRTNFCEVCGTSLMQDPEIPVETRVERNWCTTCGGYSKGVLVSRSISIQPPPPPVCIKPNCMWTYFKQALLVLWIGSYHRRRVAYAEAHRHKKIPTKYRTGESSPETLFKAILANINLIVRR